MEHIQLLTKEDISQCARIVNLNYNDQFKNTISARLQEMFSTSYNRSKPTYYTLKLGATVVAFAGFAETQFNTGSFEIFLVNVHPEFQNKGFGEKIMIKLLQEICLKYYATGGEFWLVLNCRHELIKFYQKFGFTAASSRKCGEQYLMVMNTLFLNKNINNYYDERIASKTISIVKAFDITEGKISSC